MIVVRAMSHWISPDIVVFFLVTACVRPPLPDGLIMDSPSSPSRGRKVSGLYYSNLAKGLKRRFTSLSRASTQFLNGYVVELSVTNLSVESTYGARQK